MTVRRDRRSPAIGPRHADTQTRHPRPRRPSAGAKQRVKRVGGHVRRAWPAKGANGRRRRAITRWLARQVGPQQGGPVLRSGRRGRAGTAPRVRQARHGGNGRPVRPRLGRTAHRAGPHRQCDRSEPGSQLIRSFDIPVDDPSYDTPAQLVLDLRLRGRRDRVRVGRPPGPGRSPARPAGGTAAQERLDRVRLRRPDRREQRQRPLPARSRSPAIAFSDYDSALRQQALPRQRPPRRRLPAVAAQRGRPRARRPGRQVGLDAAQHPHPDRPHDVLSGS